MTLESKDLPICYLESLDTISIADLEGFFVGWSNPPSAPVLHNILSNSTHIILAYDKPSQRVIGFINCISDGIFSAYIPKCFPNFNTWALVPDLSGVCLKKLRSTTWSISAAMRVL